MYHLFSATAFALHLAAPMEGAVATLEHGHGFCAVAAAAAHEVAAIDPDAGVVAGSPVRAGDAKSRVLLAEAGRGL